MRSRVSSALHLFDNPDNSKDVQDDETEHRANAHSANPAWGCSLSRLLIRGKPLVGKVLRMAPLVDRYQCVNEIEHGCADPLQQIVRRKRDALIHRATVQVSSKCGSTEGFSYSVHRHRMGHRRALVVSAVLGLEDVASSKACSSLMRSISTQ